MTTTIQPNEPRTTGPNHDHWPAGLPEMSYVTADGGFLCVQCANGANGSRSLDLLDWKDSNDNQWRIIGAQVNDDPTPCDHCGRIIPTQAEADHMRHKLADPHCTCNDCMSDLATEAMEYHADQEKDHD